MEHYTIRIGFVVMLLHVSYVYAKVFILQADSHRNRENHPIWNLKNSSDGHALILETHKILSINFCLRQNSVVKVRDLRFSNGNNSDVVMVEIEGLVLGLFQTPTNANHSWNLFLSTGPFPSIRVLPNGWHQLLVKFNGTSDGFAIDHIELDINDDKLNSDILSCELTCIPDQSYNVRSNDVVIESSYIVQESYKTTCPEVDNINIPIFNPGVQMYEITAALPQYRAFSNWRTENTTGCAHLSPYYWSFNGVRLVPNTRDTVETPKAKLYLSNGRDYFSKLTLMLLISFRLEGKSKGMVDSEMGTILKIKFKDLTADVHLVYKFKGRMPGISESEERMATPNRPETEWSSPDFSWTDVDYNVIFLYVSSNTSELLLDSLYLERRPMLPDQVQSIYKDDNTIIEVVFSDFWWLNPDSMSVHLTNGQTYNNISYFRIYRPIPWNSGYAQVFVLYQDGNARLLPVPPEGLDWIPFGSSVIIGQTDPTVIRPFASITDALIDTNNLVINIRYKDLGSCKLTLTSSLSETRVSVSDIYFSRNPVMYPFTTFRSMYVSEGNSDVDSVIINGLYTQHIMDDFNAIMGQNFVFHRKCMSRHLNLSPDIYIDVRRTDGAAVQTQFEQSDTFQGLLQRIQNHRYRLWTPRLTYANTHRYVHK